MMDDTSASGSAVRTAGRPAVAVADATGAEDARRGMIRLAEKARGWISSGDTLRYLAPDFPDLPVTPRAKACLEMGLLRLLWSRARPGDDGLAALSAALDAIWADPDFPRQVAAAPDYARGYGLIYCGLAPPGARLDRATLERLAPGGRLAYDGKSPYIRLETRYYADLAGLRHGIESYRDLYRDSELARATEASTDSHAAYRVTHTLFHATDFGSRVHVIGEEERRRALEIVDRMTDHFVSVEHWDLTAELLLSQHCLGQDPTRTRSGAAGVRALLSVQTTDGRIPARYATQRPSESLPPLRLFRFAYHTTLVTALACMIPLGSDGG